MKKSVLRKRPILDIKDSWKNLIQQLSNTEICYFIAAELEKIDNVNVLVLNIIDKTEQIAYRIFQSHDDYITQDFTDSDKMKWRTGSIYSVLDYRYSKRSVLLDNSMDIIKSFLEEDQSYLFVDSVHNGSLYYIKDYHEENNPLLYLELVQEEIRRQRLAKKHQAIKDKIDDKMSLIKELPEDFNQWINDSVLYKSRYIYYQYKPRKKVEGYCTHCKSDVIVEGAKHNKEGVCPNCNSPITFKAVGKSKNVCDNTYAALIQNCGHEIVVRYFSVSKSYLGDYKNPSLSILEISRDFYDDDKGKCNSSYDWWYFKQTNELRWCESIGKRYVGNSVLYTDNLDKELLGTKWQYSAIKEFAAKELGFTFPVWNYISIYAKFPGLEYLVKLKFYNLVYQILTGYYILRHDLNMNGKNLAEVLNIDKKLIPVVRRFDPDIRMLRIIRESSNAELILTDDEIKAIYENELSIDRVINLSKYTTIHKMLRYIKSQLPHYEKAKVSRYQYADRLDNIILGDWVDYIKDCNILKWDLKNDFVLFPKNLRDAHTDTNSLIVVNKNKLYNARVKEMYASIAKSFNWDFKDYAVLVPKSYDDLVEEGHKLNHCVARNYTENHINGKCVILFLRKKENIQKPFCTIQLDPKSLKVVQARGKNNKIADDDAMKIINRYEKSIVKSLAAASKVA